MTRFAFRTGQTNTAWGASPPPTSGWVAGLLAEDRRQGERKLRRLDPNTGLAAASRRRELMRARLWALRAGFPEAQVLAAAEAAVTLKAERGGDAVRKADVLAVIERRAA